MMLLFEAKTFLITKDKSINSFGERYIHNDLVIYHSFDFPPVKINLRDNSIAIVFGEIFPDSPNVDFFQYSKNLSKNQFLNYLENCFGRWVIILDNQVYNDATGLMGVFYTFKNYFYVSNNLKILKEIIGNVDLLEFPLKRMNWFPLPKTNVEGVEKLITSQYFDLDLGEVKYNSAYNFNKKNVSLNKIAEILINKVKSIQKNSDGKIFVPLSAGFDSRLILAVMIKSGIEFECFTFDKKINIFQYIFKRNRPQTNPVSHADLSIPVRICENLGIRHKIVRKGNFDQGKLKKFYKNSNNNVIENDRVYYSHGQWDWVNQSDIILPGQCFEFASEFYNKILPIYPNEEAVINFFRLKGKKFYVEGIKEWFTYYDKTKKEYGELDWRNRFYFEQRLGGWLSSLVDSLDQIGVRYIHLANSLNLYKELLALPIEQRISRKYQVDLIKILEPKLLDYPFNENDPFLKRFLDKFLKKFKP
jgi:hypothetical protein